MWLDNYQFEKVLKEISLYFQVHVERIAWRSWWSTVRPSHGFGNTKRRRCGQSLAESGQSLFVSQNLTIPLSPWYNGSHKCRDPSDKGYGSKPLERNSRSLSWHIQDYFLVSVGPWKRSYSLKHLWYLAKDTDTPRGVLHCKKTRCAAQVFQSPPPFLPKNAVSRADPCIEKFFLSICTSISALWIQI